MVDPSAAMVPIPVTQHVRTAQPETKIYPATSTAVSEGQGCIAGTQQGMCGMDGVCCKPSNPNSGGATGGGVQQSSFAACPTGTACASEGMGCVAGTKQGMCGMDGVCCVLSNPNNGSVSTGGAGGVAGVR